MHCPWAAPGDMPSWGATVLPTQPTRASAPCMLAEHPQGAPALGLVAVPEQGSVPGPLHSPTPSGTGPTCSLTTALSIPPPPLFG